MYCVKINADRKYPDVLIFMRMDNRIRDQPFDFLGADGLWERLFCFLFYFSRFTKITVLLMLKKIILLNIKGMK